MTARVGCANLITRMRGLTNSGTADYTVNAASYWTDAQVQDVLDRNRVELYRDPLQMIQQYDGGSVVYLKYQSAFQNLETGTNLELQTAAGSTLGTALYTVDQQRGMITFAANTSGSTYYITGFAYDMNSVAAAMWREKMAHYTTAVDFSTARNVSIDRSQLMANCLVMAKSFESKSSRGMRTINLWRSDTDD